MELRFPLYYVQYGTVVFVTDRKRGLQRLCFNTCLSVILFTGGVCPSAYWETPPQTRGRHTSPGPDPPRSRHLQPLGADPPSPPLGADPPEQTLPAQCMLGDTGNKRAVRILLECVLVGNIPQIEHLRFCKCFAYIYIGSTFGLKLIINVSM